MTTPPAPNPVPQGNPYASPNPYAQQAGYPQAAPVPQQAAGRPRPAPHTQPGPHPPYGQPAYLSCKFCAGVPAVPVTFRAHRGLLILMTFQKLQGPMCATCGLAVHRTYTTQTLWQGWWSPFSLFVFTPFTLVQNAVAGAKVKKLRPPAPGQHGQQYDPGKPIHQRPLAYAALVPVLWVLFMIVTGLTQA